MIERDFIDNNYEPSLEGLKKHLRITSDDQDGMLTVYLKAAIENAEHYIGSVIAHSRFTQVEVLSGKSLVLRGPVIEIKSIEVDGKPLASGSFTTFENTVTLEEEVHEKKVKVVYISGREKADYDITAAVYLTASDLFSNPVDSVRTMPTAASRLLDPHRTWSHGRI